MSKVNITVMVSGGGTNLQAIIDGIDSGYIDQGRIVQVISSRKEAFALTRASKIGAIGIHIGKDNFHDEEKRTAALIEALSRTQTGLVVLAGYMSILPPEIIKRYRHRIINIHPSLIPKFCGLGFYGQKVHEAVLACQAPISGATVHFVDEGIDTGEIILQKEVPVLKTDTVNTLSARVLEVEHRLLPEAVRLLCKKINQNLI